MNEVEQQRESGDRRDDDETEVCKPGPCEQDFQ